MEYDYIWKLIGKTGWLLIVMPIDIPVIINCHVLMLSFIFTMRIVMMVIVRLIQLLKIQHCLIVGFTVVINYLTVIEALEYINNVMVKSIHTELLIAIGQRISTCVRLAFVRQLAIEISAFHVVCRFPCHWLYCGYFHSIIRVLIFVFFAEFLLCLQCSKILDTSSIFYI